jgi:hypothetical protein
MDFRKCSQIEYELGLIKEKVIIGMRNVGWSIGARVEVLNKPKFGYGR